MAIGKLSNLYRQVILDHANNPRNRQQLEEYTGQVELLNPTCGDAIVIQYQLQQDIINRVAFSGHGCSISIASASMMTEVMKGLPIHQALHLIDIFNALVSGMEITLDSEMEEQLKDALFLEGVKQFPARYKCAILAWKALEMGIAKEQTELLEGLTMTDQVPESE